MATSILESVTESGIELPIEDVLDMSNLAWSELLTSVQSKVLEADQALALRWDTTVAIHTAQEV